MIEIHKLTSNDIGRWVRYDAGYGEPEEGRIKSWNDKVVFVVYKCGGNWSLFMEYTAESTNPRDLTFVRDSND